MKQNLDGQKFYECCLGKAFLKIPAKTLLTMELDTRVRLHTLRVMFQQVLLPLYRLKESNRMSTHDLL